MTQIFLEGGGEGRKNQRVVSPSKTVEPRQLGAT